MTRKTFAKWLIIALIFVTIIIGSFAILDHYISLNSENRWLDGGAWASIIIGAISSSATVFLGIAVLWYTKYVNKLNTGTGVSTEVAKRRKSVRKQLSVVFP